MIAAALKSLVPESEWSIPGDDYGSIVWHVEPVRRPTQEEVTGEINRLAQLAMADAVKKEAQRRIIVLTGKATLQDCMIRQFNALMRAGQLTDKRVNVGALTAEEETEAARLRALADQIKAIRAASDAIEAMSPIPADYAADSRWPG